MSNLNHRTDAPAFTLLGLALAAAASVATGCIDLPADGDTNDVEAAVTNVPPGVGCLVLTATPPPPARSVTARATVVGSATARFSLGALPSGPVTFTASGYAGACPPRADRPAVWVANPVTSTATPGPHAAASLVLEPGSVRVTLTYVGRGPLCPAGQFVCPSATGAATACSTHTEDRNNCGACGNLCQPSQNCVAGACVTPNPCPAGQFVCASATGALGACSTHTEDRSNCGACGNVCLQNQSCVAGRCVSPNACPAGQFVCASATGAATPCSTHSEDRNNCGACGNLCAASQSCVAGRCVSPNACPAGQFMCPSATGAATACSTHTEDRNNCGACGNLCQPNQNCVAGVCVTPNPCMAGQFMCPSATGAATACSTHTEDRNNCGACGNICQASQACVLGQCTGSNPCAAGQFICSDETGAATACSTHTEDRNNCGACGNACLPQQNCVAGQCVSPNPCPAGQFMCPSATGAATACSTHTEDRNNCGACGNLCQQNQNCVGGACVTPNSCPAGQFICLRPNGAATPCSTHTEDRSNCGACGNLCQPQQSCINGACVTPNSCPAGQFICPTATGAATPCSPHTEDRNNCGACGNLCAPQQNCVAGVCVTPNPCPAGQFMCPSATGAATACSTHTEDRNNCGACGNLCQQNQNCINGVCITPNACPAGQFICPTATGAATPCSTHSEDRSNCGACGNLCEPQQSCVSGACVTPNACPAGQFICPTATGAATPCSTHSEDRNNCGACGNLCEPQQSCVSGACVTPNACPAGQFICPTATGAATPCSTHSEDRNNCGACGNLCEPQQSCVAGACITPNSCPAGQFICPTATGAATPCSTHSEDRNNCGACGNLCEPQQSCVAGACITPNACPAGQFICPTATGAATPCSTHSEDRNNCGACGNLCEPQQSCVAGACITPNACPAGQFICPTATGAATPCSTHSEDRNNCGACGNLCAANQRCLASICQ